MNVYHAVFRFQVINATDTGSPIPPALVMGTFRYCPPAIFPYKLMGSSVTGVSGRTQ